MLIASTKKMGYNTANNAAIYTRSRQIEYKTKLQSKTVDKKISQKTLYYVLFLVVILLFCSWFGMIFFKSVISGVQMDINEVNTQIRSLDQENSMLAAEKIKALNIESIKSMAENMGMSLPDAYQVEYVDTEHETSNLKIID